MIADLLGLRGEIHGISPFSSAGDQVSSYVEIDYLSDTLQSFAKFSQKKPELLKAYSTDPAARDYIASKQWDMIYIDGSHDFDIVLSDYRLSLSSLALGALLVMDDSSLRSVTDLYFSALAATLGRLTFLTKLLLKKCNSWEELGTITFW